MTLIAPLPHGAGTPDGSTSVAAGRGIQRTGDQVPAAVERDRVRNTRRCAVPATSESPVPAASEPPSAGRSRRPGQTRRRLVAAAPPADHVPRKIETAPGLARSASAGKNRQRGGQRQPAGARRPAANKSLCLSMLVAPSSRAIHAQRSADAAGRDTFRAGPPFIFFTTIGCNLA